MILKTLVPPTGLEPLDLGIRKQIQRLRPLGCRNITVATVNIFKVLNVGHHLIYNFVFPNFHPLHKNFYQ